MHATSSSSSCDDKHLSAMPKGATCTAPWHTLRHRLHPSQAAVGFAAVQRKQDKDYQTAAQAEERMNQTPGSILPVVLGPAAKENDNAVVPVVPYLVDSHHTIRALEASGHYDVNVTLQKLGDWSHLSQPDFFKAMQEANFMNGTDRPANSGGTGSSSTTEEDSKIMALPVPVDVSKAIPSTIAALRDDPWRSLAALVRKVKKKKQCPSEHPACLRGYHRPCAEIGGGGMPFFEFRWAYFFNDAYRHGCDNPTTCFWDDMSDCKRFEVAYQALWLKQNNRNGKVGDPVVIGELDIKAWQKAAKLLVPLCRSAKAQTYTLPASLGAPMGGEALPGHVAGQATRILKPDPSCQAPTCPDLPGVQA